MTRVTERTDDMSILYGPAPEQGATAGNSKKPASRCPDCGSFVSPAHGCPRCKDLQAARMEIRLLETGCRAKDARINDLSAVRMVLLGEVTNLHADYLRAVLIAIVCFAAAVAGWAMYLGAR